MLCHDVNWIQTTKIKRIKPKVRTHEMLIQAWQQAQWNCKLLVLAHSLPEFPQQSHTDANDEY